ncbi:hypothetical protein V8G54_008263 [Vigna mungo]|uniref:Uncharacterized protein n=1 Tax=Vigna mungo TaxID=3915 RepID=A0AAQ3S9Q4_VIGMU
MLDFSIANPLPESSTRRRWLRRSKPSARSTVLALSTVDTLEMAATIFSFMSEGESSRRTSTGTTPWATAMVTFLSSSLRRSNRESIAEVLDSGDPICNRVIRFRDAERIASLLEVETAALSMRRPLRKRMSQSVTWRSRVARRESRSLWVLSLPLRRSWGWHVRASKTASLSVREIEWRRWRERGLVVEA